MKPVKPFILMMAAIVVLFAVVYAGYSSAGLWKPTVVHDDAFQQLPYFHRAQNPDLFRGDVTTDYMKHYVPPVYRTAVYAASRFFDPLNVGKAISMLMFLLALIASGLIGYRTAGAAGGLALALVVLSSPMFHERGAAGLPRSFAFPLTLGFIAAASWQRWKTAGAVVLAAAAFYPTVALYLVPAWVCFFHREWRAEITARRYGYALTWLLLLAGLSAWAMYRPDWVGRPFSYAEARAMPEWSRMTGRFPEFPWFKDGRPLILHYAIGYVRNWNGFAWTVFTGGMTLAILGWLMPARRPRTIPVEARLYGVLAVSLIAGFMLSYFLAFRLFLPVRVLEFGLPPLLWCVGLLLPAAVVRERTEWKHAAATMAAVLLIAVYALKPFAIDRAFGYVKLSPEKTALCAFVKSLPADVVVAGALSEIDPIPLLSQRVVYISFETAHPLFTNYYAEVKRRLLILAALYFAVDEAGARAATQGERITHLVVDTAHYDANPRNVPWSFEPIKTAFQMEKSKAGGRFFFARPPEKAVVFRNENYLVVELALLGARSRRT